MIGLFSLQLLRPSLPWAEAVVSRFQDVATMGQAVLQSGGHLGIAEDGSPFAEAGGWW